MPYDELGNYVPGDDAPSADEMRYELAKRRKAETVSDLLDKYISDPIRGVSTAGSEIIKRLPGADLAQAAMNLGSGMVAPLAAVPVSIYKGIQSGEYGKSTDVAGRQFEDTMRELTYEPRTQGGRDIMEGIAKAIDVTKLPPYIGHIYAPRTPLSANDVRVLAKRGIETGREIAAIPEDFLAAQQGLKRESNLGGTTYGAKLQGVAEDIGDVAARRAARMSDEGRVPRPGSVEVFGNLVPETNLYAVKPTGGQLVKSIDPVTGQLREVPESSVAGISDVYETIRRQTEGPGLINQYLRTFVNRPGIEPIWDDFNAKKVQQEFPNAPTPSDARQAFDIKYPTAKARNDRMVSFFDEFAESPDAQAAAKELGISIPTFEDYQKRIEAANTWAQKGLTNYVQKFVGTKEDPALQLATQGVTFKDPERLLENATTALNYANPAELKAERKAAGFNEEGEVQPFLKEKMTELKAVDDQLRDMVVRRNALYEQARQQNVDPASNPEYAELTNKLASKTAEKARITQQAENYKLGKAYETIADLAIEKRPVSELKKKLTFAEKQLFPYLDKTPEDATLYDVDPTSLERLGLTDMASKFMDDIVSGKIPLDQIGNISIPKYIQETSAARMAKEAARKKDLAAQQKLFDNYLQEQVQSIPGDKIFGNAGVLEITNAMDEDTIRRHLSTDTEILDHCVGQGGQGRNDKQYIPMVDPVTGEPPKGSSGENTSYVRRILEKGTKIASFRDLVTGKPVGTLELNQNRDGKYDVGYASGYRNGRMQSLYSESLANYLNSIEDQIEGAGDNLTKNGVIDKQNYSKHDMRDITGLSESDLKQLSFDGMPRFMTRDAIINLNNERKSMMPSAQLNTEASTLNTSYAELLDENQRLNFDLQNADDDLVREDLMSRRSEIQSQLNDIGQRIGNLPIEELTNTAREMINDIFPERLTTARGRLQHLDNESPISMRIQPRLFETIRDVLRDQRDAIGAPLSTTQQMVVNDEWQRISREIATQQMVGDRYNGNAIANNIRRNPDRYGLGDYQDQIIHGIADQVERRGLLDPRNAPLGYIDQYQSTLPRQVVERLNSLFGNVLRGEPETRISRAIDDLRQYQDAYINPPAQSAIRDLTETQRNEAIGEIQRRIEDLQLRAQRNPLINNASPEAQRQDLPVVVDRLGDAIDEEYGQAVGAYVREALDTINYNVAEDPVLYIERVRQLAAQSADEQPVREAFNMVADRLVEGVRANNAIDTAVRDQPPVRAFTPPNTNVGNVVQNLINQYPDAMQVQALINDLEHGEYSELPTALLNADEIVVDDTVSQIIEQLQEYRDSIPYEQAPAPVREQRLETNPAALYERHGTNVMDAYYEILRDNNQFRTPDEMDALRALPQLIRREGATRNALGIGNFSNENANQLARIFEALYEARMQDFARNENNRLTPPEPEGRKDGGYIQSSKNRLLSPNTDEMRLALLKGK